MDFAGIHGDLDGIAGAGGGGGGNAGVDGEAFAVEVEIGFRTHQLGDFHPSLPLVLSKKVK